MLEINMVCLFVLWFNVPVNSFGHVHFLAGGGGGGLWPVKIKSLILSRVICKVR